MLLMVGEMTGNLSLLAPAMIAVALSTALVGDETIYRSQLPDRSSAPAHRVRLSFPLLSSLRVRDAMTALPEGYPTTGAPNGALHLSQELTLDDALEQITTADVIGATVVEREQPVGNLTTRDIVASYKLALAHGVRRTRRLGAESSLLEATVAATSPLAGKMLQEIQFPDGALVVSITRDDGTVFPRGDPTLQAGDRVMLVADARSEHTVRTFLETHTAP